MEANYLVINGESQSLHSRMCESVVIIFEYSTTEC